MSQETDRDKERLPDALHETVPASSLAKVEQGRDGRPGPCIVGMPCSCGDRGLRQIQ